MSPSQSIWLNLSCIDFLSAIKTLKPPHMPKTHALKELQIGLVKGEAISPMEGAQTHCQAIGEWNGFYNLQRFHQCLKMKTPAQTYEMHKLAA